MLAEDLNNPQINCISLNNCRCELFFRMAVFLLLMALQSVVGHSFPQFDLSFVNQLGGTIY